MKKGILSYYNYLVIVASCILLPGCAIVDSIFGTKAKEDVYQQSSGASESITDIAIEALTDDGTVGTESDTSELTGRPIITMNGKVIVTSDSLEIAKNNWLESNPQIAQVLSVMGDREFLKNLADGLRNQAVVDQAIMDRGINKTAEYKKEMKDGFTAVERVLNTNFFVRNLNVRVSDADVQKFYDQNKDSIPELIIMRGGIKAMGIAFGTAVEAQSFAQQVTAQGNDIKKAAQAVPELVDKVQDFMTVHKDSIIRAEAGQELKTKILEITKVPGVEVITLKNNSVWVVATSGKEEAQYRPFDQVKAGLKEHLEKEATLKKFDEEVNKLIEKYKVTVDESYFAEEQGEETDLDFDAVSPEDFISQLEEEDLLNTVAYQDIDMPCSI